MKQILVWMETAVPFKLPLQQARVALCYDHSMW